MHACSSVSAVQGRLRLIQPHAVLPFVTSYSCITFLFPACFLCVIISPPFFAFSLCPIFSSSFVQFARHKLSCSRNLIRGECNFFFCLQFFALALHLGEEFPLLPLLRHYCGCICTEVSCSSFTFIFIFENAEWFFNCHYSP